MKNAIPILCLVFASGCQIPLALQESGAEASSGYWGTGAAAATAPSPPGVTSEDSDLEAAKPASPRAEAGTSEVEAPTKPQVAAEASATETPLLDWSGGVVDAPRAGSIHEVGRVGSRGLQESFEGRMHIIELYQSVLDERDQLLTEVDALQAALAKAQEELQAERDQEAALSTRVSALEEAKRRLMEENAELASRLTTAQLRRLEAEKLLLETQIAWNQEKSEAAARSVVDRLGAGDSR